jgi:uncharacterized protein (TIGR02996 family)
MTSTITTPDQAFLDAVVSVPDDVAPRLMYADWLEERGDPRGEFIRVQCELAAWRKDDANKSLSGEGVKRHAALRRRERELMDAHGKAWTD